MPIATTTAALIGALGSAAAAGIGTAGAAASTAINNRRQWKNWLKTHNIERSEYLADREYNSPRSQMQRYLDAGLNPNLIYGQDNTTSVMSQNSPPVTESSARAYLEGFDNLANSFRMYDQFLTSSKQRELMDSNISANDAKEKYYDAMANFTRTKDDIEFLKYDAFNRGNYWDEYVRQRVFGNKILQANTQFLENTVDYRIQQVMSMLRWYNLRNEALNIENVWNRPKSLIPQTQLFNMWKNISDQKGWLGTHLMSSQRDLNNASVLSKVAQTNLYNQRSGLTQMKEFFIPLEWLVKAGFLLLK